MGAGGLDNQEINGRLERLGASMGASLANDFIALRLETLTPSVVIRAASIPSSEVPLIRPMMVFSGLAFIPKRSSIFPLLTRANYGVNEREIPR